jgi:hypothetical protein
VDIYGGIGGHPTDSLQEKFKNSGGKLRLLLPTKIGHDETIA